MKNERIWQRLKTYLPDDLENYVLQAFVECFDYSIPKHWDQVIADVVMLAYWRWNNKEKTIKIVQVKQKFGFLRFYIDGDDDEYMYGAIQMAERQCTKICAHCGSYGVPKEKPKTRQGVQVQRWNKKCEKCKDRI